MFVNKKGGKGKRIKNLGLCIFRFRPLITTKSHWIACFCSVFGLRSLTHVMHVAVLRRRQIFACAPTRARALSFSGKLKRSRQFSFLIMRGLMDSGRSQDTFTRLAYKSTVSEMLVTAETRVSPLFPLLPSRIFVARLFAPGIYLVLGFIIFFPTRHYERKTV